MKQKFSILFLALIVASLFFPAFVHAQSDQRCWLDFDCLEQRKWISLDTLNDKQLKEGFVVNNETIKACGGAANAAGKGIGFCLPAGQAETAISFGGERRFANIGEFIAMIYRYGTWSATIVAVFMILISGIQWMVSGGNSGMIDSAKKRIGGAIIGLVLLALSYSILSTLNPYLVNFRLPAVWLINEIKIAPPMCNQLHPDQEVLEMSQQANEKFDISSKEKFFNKNKLSNDFKPIGKNNWTKCGFEYLVKDAGAQSCSGSSCPDFGTCMPYDIVYQQKKDGYTCSNSQIVVHLSMSGFVQKNIWQNIPWSGTLTGKTTEVPDWISTDPWGSYEPKEIHYQCANGNWGWVNATKNTFLEIDIANPGQKAKGDILSTTNDFYEYELRYYKLHNLNTKCDSGTTPPTRILLKHEINLDVDTDEPNFFIGRVGKTEQAMIGTFKQVEQYAIPWEDVEKGGIYLKAEFGDDTMNSVVADVNNSSPNPPPPPGSKEPKYSILNCFLAGTQIKVAGGQKSIEHIREGDIVITYDIVGRKNTFAKILGTIKRQNKGYYRLNDGLLELTEGHPIYTRKASGYTGWASLNPEKTRQEIPDLPVEKLEKGDEVRLSSGNWITLDSVVYKDIPVTVYNLETDGPHTFFANEVLVHNKPL